MHSQQIEKFTDERRGVHTVSLHTPGWVVHTRMFLFLEMTVYAFFNAFFGNISQIVRFKCKCIVSSTEFREEKSAHEITNTVTVNHFS